MKLKEMAREKVAGSMFKVFLLFTMCSIACVLFLHKQIYAANGSVLTVKQTQIEFFLGIEDGIYTAQELYILRGRKILGKIQVTFVGEMTSWGDIVSLEAGDVPVPGDQISSSAPFVKNKTNVTLPVTKIPSAPVTSTVTPAADKTKTKSPSTTVTTKVTPATVTTTNTPSPSTTTSSITPSATTSTLTTQQKELLKKKEIGKKGTIYLVLENQAGITLGRKAGLKEGDEVVVFQGNEVAGKVKVKTLLEDYALCEIQPTSGKTFKKGDVVIFNPNLVVDEKKDDKKETPPPASP